MSPIATLVTRPSGAALRAALVGIMLVGALAAQTDGSVPPPSNDDCLNAAVAILGANPGTTYGATNNLSTPCSSDPDVWYAFTPSVSGGYRFHVNTTGATQISNVYLGGCNQLLGEDCINTTGASLPALVAGVTYYIQISDWNASDVFTFHIDPFTPPANDECSGALPVVVGANPVDATGADYDAFELCGDDQNVWYAFTPTTTGGYVFTTVSAAGGEIEGIYSGVCGALVPLACGGASTFTLPLLTAGVTYYVELSDWRQGGVFTLDIAPTAAAPAPGDACTTALVATLGLNAGDSTSATAYASGGCNTSDPNVWFAFTPAASGAYSFHTPSGGVPIVAGVYSGSCDALYSYGCPFSSDFRVDGLLAGVTYYVEISDWSQAGAFTLDIVAEAAPAAGDACSTAVAAILGSNPYDASSVTAIGGGPCSQQIPNVWFAFTPATTGAYSFSALPEGDYDLVALYTGACDGSGAVSCIGEQTASFANLIGGVTYYLEVAQWGAAGPMSLEVAALAPPVNDECVNAIPMSVGVVATTSTASATDSPVLACGDIGADVWYSFTAACAGAYTFATCGLSSDDTVVAVYSACGDLIACEDDSCGSQSGVTTAVAVGSTVLVRVGGYSGRRVTTGVSVSIASGLSLEFTTTPGAVTMSISGGTPGKVYFAPLSGFAGGYPNGSFFGIDISFVDLLLQASAGPPFLGVLDGCGGTTQGPFLGVPPGLTLYGVALDDLSAPFLRASPPTTFTTL